MYRQKTCLIIIIIVPFCAKHKTAEIAMITAIAPNATPITLPRIISVLGLDLVGISVKINNNIIVESHTSIVIKDPETV